MKLSIAFISAIAGLATAAAPGILQRRQTTQNDLKNGACKKVTLIFARASTEIGNMGESMGPAVCSGLKGKLGAASVACQGVGGAYSAGLMDNVSAKGTSEAAIKEAQAMFNLANTKCPQSTVVAGGYSQGTAVMMNAISTLPEGVRSKIVGVVLFGYTKNGQTKGTIPNFPTENLKVFCTKGDGVCWGQLNVSGGHFAYMGNGDGTAATKFLLEKIAAGPKAPKSSGDSSEAPTEEAPAPAAAAPSKGRGMPKAKGKGNFMEQVESLRMTMGMMRVRRRS